MWSSTGLISDTAMTKDEFKKLKFRFVTHLSMEHEHCLTGVNDETKIWVCIHIPYKDGVPHGRSYKHYRCDFLKDTFKSVGKLLKAYNEALSERGGKA